MDRVRVTGRGAARWRRGHPWIYRSDVADGPTAAGAVLVEDDAARLIGTALWSPRSTIAVRMLSRDAEAPDAAFWLRRLERAVRYREDLGLRARDGETTAYRVVHGEADGLPSLIVDLYGEVVVVQLLSAGLEAFRKEVVAGLRAVLEPAGILARNDVAVRRIEGLDTRVQVLWGEVPEEVDVVESGIRGRVPVRTGQKTGAFLDQRENRVRAGGLSRGRALDCFSYHGWFALHLARRAAEVVAVEASAPARARARENAERNGLANVTTVEANVFEYLRSAERAGERYEVVVLDPPAFAKRRSAVGSALRGYQEINLRAIRLLAPAGHLCTFSCSYHVSGSQFAAMLRSAAADAGRPLRWIEARGQSADHPVIVQIPETGYLKGAILQAVE